MMAFGSGIARRSRSRSVSKFPLSRRAMTVGVVGGVDHDVDPDRRLLRLDELRQPEHSRSCWLVSRCTVGFGKPDAATSFLASAGSYGVHGTFVGSNQSVFAGGISVQLGW